MVQDVRELGSLDSQVKEDRSTDGGLGQLYNDEWVWLGLDTLLGKLRAWIYFL